MQEVQSVKLNQLKMNTELEKVKKAVERLLGFVSTWKRKTKIWGC